jgi:UTP-glucose-1-phosphate uridylyltransferase
MMNDILCELINEGKVIVYLDDILIFTESLEEHWTIVKRVLEILEKNQLYLKPQKCDFEKMEIKYLGVIIGHNSMQMDLVKIKGIMEWPELQTGSSLPTNSSKCLSQGFSALQANFRRIKMLLDMTSAK